MAEAPTRVLDLASPKLLAAWLAEHTPATVVATDLLSTEIERWRRLIRAADPSGRRYHRLTLETADGTALGYEDESFDVAYSVSVIEHIPGSGDSKAMSELARVLRPGGLLILTFPYRKTSRRSGSSTTFTASAIEGEPLFFCRHYSAEAVQERSARERAHSTSSSRCCGARKVCRRHRSGRTGSFPTAGRWATCSDPCFRSWAGARCVSGAWMTRARTTCSGSRSGAADGRAELRPDSFDSASPTEVQLWVWSSEPLRPHGDVWVFGARRRADRPPPRSSITFATGLGRRRVESAARARARSARRSPRRASRREDAHRRTSARRSLLPASWTRAG